MVPHHHCSPADRRGRDISVDTYHPSLTSRTLECHILKQGGLYYSSFTTMLQQIKQ